MITGLLLFCLIPLGGRLPSLWWSRVNTCIWGLTVPIMAMLRQAPRQPRC